MYLKVEPYHTVLQQFDELLQHPEFLFRLIGIEGSGKTSLLKQLCSVSESKGFVTGFFPDCPKSPAELRKLIRARFSLPRSHNFNRVLERQLLEGKEYSKGVVLFFDDCHLMSDETLLDLATLTEIKVSEKRMLSIVCCGTPEFNKRLTQNAQLQSLLQRFTGTAELSLLDHNTLPLYIYRYFETHEKTSLEFEKAAFDRIYKLTKGFPGAVTGICRKLADSQAGLMTSTPVTKADIATLAKNYYPDNGESWYSENRMLMAGGAVAVVVVLAVFLGLQVWLESSPTAPVTVTTNTAPVISAAPSVFVDTTPAEVPAATAVVEADPVVAEPVVAEPFIAETVVAETVVAEPIVEDPVVDEPVFEETAIATTEPLVEAPAAAPAVGEAAVIAPVTSTESETSPEPAEDPIELAVYAWGEAWRNQDIDAYFGSYHAEFEPRGFPSLSAWRENRQRNIAGRDGIIIDITEFSIVSSDADSAEVYFWLHYESPGYSDDTLKMLNFIREGERWLIVSEINLEVSQR